MTQFLALSRSKPEVVRRLVDALVGRRIVRAAYRYFPASISGEYAGAGAEIDVDLSAVVVGFDDGGAQTITWTTQGLLQSIAIPGPDGDAPRPAESAVDMSASSNWQSVLGQRIESIQLSWHECSSLEGSFEHPVAVWAAQIVGADGPMVTIALGTLDASGELQFSPDDLVVWFPPVEGYTPAHTTSPFETWTDGN